MKMLVALTGWYSDGLYSDGRYSDKCGLGLGLGWVSIIVISIPYCESLMYICFTSVQSVSVFPQIWAENIRWNSIHRYDNPQNSDTQPRLNAVFFQVIRG